MRSSSTQPGYMNRQYGNRREYSVANNTNTSSTSKYSSSSTTVTRDGVTTTTTTSSRRTERTISETRETAPAQVAPSLASALDAPSNLVEGDMLSLEARFSISEPQATIVWHINGRVRLRFSLIFPFNPNFEFLLIGWLFDALMNEY